MNRIRFFFLLTQGAFGVYMPFANVFFEQERGLTGREIGLLAAIAPVMTLLVAPAWATAADRHGSRLSALRWAVAGAGASVLMVSLPNQFWPTILAVGLFTSFQVAIIPLGDGISSAAATARGIPYGNLRLWGSLGFALSGLLVGQLIRWLGLGVIFPAYATLMLLALPAMWRMVSREPPPPGAVRARARALLQDRPLALFLVVAGLAATGITVGYTFLYVFLGTLGASPGLMGAVSAVGALAEVPLMLWGGRLIKRRGAAPVFAAGMVSLALAWALYAMVAEPGLAPLIHLLCGAGMGLLWPAGVTFVAERAPAEMTATAQSLLNAVMYGLAPLIASQIAGHVFDAAGARAVLGVAAGILVAGVSLYFLMRSRLDPAGAQHA